MIPDELYKTILEHIPICTVDVIFLNKQKDKILLFKRNNEPAKGMYFTIGGRWHKGENLLACVLRQVKCEVGIDIDPKKTFFGGFMEEHWNTSAFEVAQTNIDFFYGYLLEDTENIRLDAQHSEHKWFSIYDQSLHPNVRERIKQTLEAKNI